MTKNTEIVDEKKSKFYLEKWFLDCVTEEGEVLIFYAAQLKWHRWQVPYTSSLHYDPSSGMDVQSRFRAISMPEKEDQLIRWQDSNFGISGNWDALTPAINARLFDSDKGYLDWYCYQPRSRVSLHLKGRRVEGYGYAEKLIMTVEPWQIPMDELRWGRYGSKGDSIVWIEMKGPRDQLWLWYNGERLSTVGIEDEQLMMPDKGLVLELDKGVVLESEKKIRNVVQSLLRHIPGFNKSMTSRFLMSEESKWCSRGLLRNDDKVVSNGWAIHECVNFIN